MRDQSVLRPAQAPALRQLVQRARGPRAGRARRRRGPVPPGPPAPPARPARPRPGRAPPRRVSPHGRGQAGVGGVDDGRAQLGPTSRTGRPASRRSSRRSPGPRQPVRGVAAQHGHLRVGLPGPGGGHPVLGPPRRSQYLGLGQPATDVDQPTGVGSSRTTCMRSRSPLTTSTGSELLRGASVPITSSASWPSAPRWRSAAARTSRITGTCGASASGTCSGARPARSPACHR